MLEFPIVANPPFVQPVDGWKKRHRLEQGPVRVFYEKLTGIVKGVGAILEKHDPSFVLAREHSGHVVEGDKSLLRGGEMARKETGYVEVK